MELLLILCLIIIAVLTTVCIVKHVEKELLKDEKNRVQNDLITIKWCKKHKIENKK